MLNEQHRFISQNQNGDILKTMIYEMLSCMKNLNFDKVVIMPLDVFLCQGNAGLHYGMVHILVPIYVQEGAKCLC